MEQQSNYYAIVPANVRYDKRLKANAKLLYGEITALCGREGFCWAGNDYFADLYEVDHKTISRWISQLFEFGYVDVELLKSEGNKRKITIDKKVTRYTQKNHEVVTKKSLGSDKKSTSNIRMNITINNTKNIEGTAIEFLSTNYPTAYEQFLMKYKSKIPDWEKLVDDFNCKVIEEKKEFDQAILFARLTRLANNWISRNNSGFGVKSAQVEQTGPKRTIFTGN